MKIYLISIISSITAIVLNFLLNDYYLNIFALILVLSVGLLHGANDILIIKKMILKNSNTSFNSYVFIYSIIVLLSLLLFYFIPWLILLAFIFISAYHFGEQQLQIKSKLFTFTSKVLFFVYGMTILTGLFFLNDLYTSEIIYDITKLSIPLAYFNYLFIFFLGCTLVISGYTLIQNRIDKIWAIRELIILLLILLVFYFSDLLFGFAIYFVFWHTLPSLKEQVDFIYKEQSNKSYFNYTLKAFPYWLMSIIGLFVLYYFFGDQNMFLSIMFAFIAAVTFPHVIVIERMFNQLKSN